MKVSGLRVVATILKRGSPGMSMADVRIYGMSQSVRNTLYQLRVAEIVQARNNVMTVSADDAVNGMAAVYSGTILNARQNLDGQPDTFFGIHGITGSYDTMKPVPALSFNGSAYVATIMSGIATTIGKSFENNGVQVKLSNQYLPGTALAQAHKLADAANIELAIDDQTVAIWPKNGTRCGIIPLISPASGLVGYPEFAEYGMRFRCLFNPSIKFCSQIEMQSSMTQANGMRYVNGRSYDLSAQVVNGPRFCDVSCSRLSGTPGRV